MKNHGGTRPGIPQPQVGPAAAAGEAHLGVGGSRQPEPGSAPSPSRSPVGEGRARAAPSQGAAEALFSRSANTQRCPQSWRRGSGSLVAARNVLGTPRRAASAAPGRVLSLRPSGGSGQRSQTVLAPAAPRNGWRGSEPRERCPPPAGLSPPSRHTQAAGGGGGAALSDAHTPETPIIFSLTRCFCCPRLLTLQRSCQQASMVTQNPHTTPSPDAAAAHTTD